MFKHTAALINAVITIRKHLDGAFTFWFKGKKLGAGELQRKPEAVTTKAPEKPIERTFKPPKPKANHPWRNVPSGYVNPKQYHLAKLKLNEIQQHKYSTDHIKDQLI